MSEENGPLFHTTLRNVGLFITLSFATLTYSQKYSDKFLQKIFILFCFLFLSVSTVLLLDLKKNKYKYKDGYKNIPDILLVIVVTLFIYILNKLVFKK
tara:strand:- start:203 stop:496 length:294 start_codon:yes stop_codon:yes gene_type:complete